MATSVATTEDMPPIHFDANAVGRQEVEGVPFASHRVIGTVQSDSYDVVGEQAARRIAQQV
jgi:hypothetical protein